VARQQQSGGGEALDSSQTVGALWKELALLKRQLEECMSALTTEQAKRVELEREVTKLRSEVASLKTQAGT